MPREIIDIGSVANDGNGDPLRECWIKVNTMTSEIYTTLGNGTTLSGANLVSAIDAEIGNSTWQSGGGATPVQDDASEIVAAPTALNFTGAGVTVTDVSGVATIDIPSGGTVDVVSNLATSTIVGRITAGSGDSEELTPAQVRTLINVADGADVSPVTSVAGEVGVISAADLRTALNVEDGATADQTGAEIVSAINAEIGNDDWQTPGIVSNIQVLAVNDTHDVVLADAGKIFEVAADASSYSIVRVPDDTTLNLPIGFTFSVVKTVDDPAYDPEVAALNASVSINGTAGGGANITGALYSAVTVYKSAANSWIAFGAI
jgi:hypothetical protein